jgi:hypothetical protein
MRFELANKRIPNTENEESYVEVEEKDELYDNDRVWASIEEENDSEPACDEDKTDDEDWSGLEKVSNKTLNWTELATEMQQAALDVNPTSSYIGTSRSAKYRKKVRLRDAAKGSSSLFSFGFTSTTNSENQPTRGIQCNK